MRSLVLLLILICGMVPAMAIPQSTVIQAPINPAGKAFADSLQLPSGSASFFGSPHLLPAAKYNPDQPGNPLTKDNSHDWKILIILTGLAVLAAARYFFGSRVSKYFRAAFGSIFFSQMEREGGFFNETVTYLLFLNYLIALTMLSWQSVLFFHLSLPSVPVKELAVFVIILLAIILFYLAKSSLLGFLAWLFGTREATSAYLKNIFLFNQLIGLVLLPFISYIAFSPSRTSILIAWAIWLVLSAAKIFRGTIIGRNNISFSAYYLILYLCMVELVPFLLMVKLGTIYLVQA